MARVRSFTSERMLEIENSTVVDGEINEAGNLLLFRRDGVSIDAGKVSGPKGDPGSGVSDVDITYQAHDSGTEEPTGTWTTTIPHVPDGYFLWVRTVTTYTNPLDPEETFQTTTYSVTRNSLPGADGRGISSTYIQYQAHHSGVNPPEGDWFGNPPVVPDGYYLWTRTILTYTDASTHTLYFVAKQGADGANGAKGEPGDNGLPTYLHVAYASNSTGTENFSTSDPSNRSYMGTYSDHTQADSTSPHDYVWTLIRGAQGGVGPTGVGISSSQVRYQVGTNGTSAPTGTWTTTVPDVDEGLFLWTRTVINFTDGASATTYSVAKQGVSGLPGSDGRGIVSVTEEYYQSNSPDSLTGGSWSTTRPEYQVGKYYWTRSVIQFTSGSPTTTEPLSVSGEDGLGITDMDVLYYLSTSNTSLTGGSWVTVAPPWQDDMYLWTRTVTTYSDESVTMTDPVCVTGTSGPKGADGVDGSDGRGILNTVIHYQQHANGLTPPTGTWSDGIPEVTSGNYLWIRTTINYSFGDPTTSYSVSRMGANGANGTPGAAGADGQTSYLHVAYANSADGTTNFSTTDPTGRAYMGTYTDFTIADSTTPSAYTWSLIKGSDGKGISSTTVRYQVSSSGTTTPTGTWLTNPQAAPDGKFLWTRTVILFTDGASTTTYSVAKSGDKGSQGDAGRGVANIETLYKAAKNLAPKIEGSGNWVEVDRNYYPDSAITDLLPVWTASGSTRTIVDAPWSAVGKAMRYTVPSGNAATGSELPGPGINYLPAGEVFTVEFDYLASHAGEMSSSKRAGTGSTTIIQHDGSGTQAVTAGVPVHMWATFTRNGTGGRLIGAMTLPAGGWVEVSNVMVYPGTKRVDYKFFGGASSRGVFDPDCRTRFTDTPNASESVMEIERVAGITGINAIAGVSPRDGKPAVRLISLGVPSSGTPYVFFTVPTEARSGGTVVGTLHIQNELTGTFPANTRRLGVYYPYQLSEVSPNTPGIYPHRITYGTLTNEYMAIFYAGARIGGGDVLWTDIGLFAGDFFDYSTWQTTEPAYDKELTLWRVEKITYDTDFVEYTEPTRVTSWDGINDIGDNSVVGHVLEYAVSTSGTTAPTTGWSTTQPNRPAAHFTWMRIKLVYGDGRTETTTPIMLSGDKGDIGISVTSSIDYYRLGTTAPAKPTTLIPTGWTVVEPGYTEGSTNNLYKTTRTIYSDNSFTYTDVTLSSSYTAAKNANTRLDVVEPKVTTVQTDLANKPIPTSGFGPPTDNAPEGSIYWEEDSDGNIVANWRREGDPLTWSIKPFSPSVVPMIDIGSGTFGELVGDRLLAKSIGAEQITAETITALVAELTEAFIDSAHIHELDVSKLVATEATISSAIIDKLWSEVIQTKFLEVTDQFIAGSAIIDNTLEARHIAAEFYEGTHFKGVYIEGGTFEGATYELVTTEEDDWIVIYSLGTMATANLPESIGGALSDMKTGVISSGNVRYNSIPQGHASILWWNKDVTPVSSNANRLITIQVRAQHLMTGVHITIAGKTHTFADIPANTARNLQVQISKGERLEYAHFGAVLGAAGWLEFRSISVRSSALAGAKLSITHEGGVPGLRVHTSTGNKVLDISPNGVTSTSAENSDTAKLQHGSLEFTGGGEVVKYDRDGINNPLGLFTISSPNGIHLNAPNLPRAMAVGWVTTSANGGATTVIFPVGRFTGVSEVSITGDVRGQSVVSQVHFGRPSASSFSVRTYTYNGTQNASTLYWHAFQMKPTSPWG